MLQRDTHVKWSSGLKTIKPHVRITFSGHKCTAHLPKLTAAKTVKTARKQCRKCNEGSQNLRRQKNLRKHT